MLATLRIVSLVVVAAIVTASARAQCGDWSAGFELPGFDATVRASVVFDDGSGPALYLGGDFTHVGTLAVDHVARWDGTAWSSVGGGIDGTVNALAVWDDGSGAALYVGGSYQHAGGAPIEGIARWNGSAWSGLAAGIHGSVFAMRAYDDGTGEALFVGGGNAFHVNGGPNGNVARWSGTSWTIPPLFIVSGVRAMAVYDDGAGPALFVGGTFTSAGNPNSSVNAFLVRWNGTQLSHATPRLDSSFGPGVYALAVHDDGSGSKLYVGGGTRLVAPGSPQLDLATWDGTTWQILAGGAAGDATTSVVESLLVHDDGAGAVLDVGGKFTSLGGTAAKNVARRSAGTFAQLGAGVESDVLTLASFDAGGGPSVFAGGSFTATGSIAASRVARFDGNDWSATTSGNGIAGVVSDVLAFDDGSGPALYAVGSFHAAGGVHAENVARWDGARWSPVGAGLSGSTATALGVFDDGQGPALYACVVDDTQPSSALVRWDGASWIECGTTPGRAATDLAVYDPGTGPALYVLNAGGNGLLRWDGSTLSAAPGYTLGIDPFNVASSMVVHDFGSGAKLYIARDDGVAIYDGTSTVRYFSQGYVTGLAVHGGAVYAAGSFTTIDPFALTSPGLARFDGATWSSVGAGAAGAEAFVFSVASLDLGAGPELFVSGSFTSIDGVAALGIARWNGAAWSALGSGIVQTIQGVGAGRMAVFAAPGSGPDLFVGGSFSSAGGRVSSSVARFEGCDGPGSSFCAGDGVDASVTTTCPCANFGALGRGCANSASAAGALLVGTGSTELDTVVLNASSMPMTASTTFLQGDALDDAVFGDGVRCIGGSLLRLRTKINVGGASRFPDASDTVTLSQRGQVTPGSGLVRHYQADYRNAATSFCPPATFNVTNGWTIVW